MTVRPQQDLGLGQVLTDFPDQPAQIRGTLSSFGTSCRAEQGLDQPSVAIKDDNRLEAVFVIVAVEQTQLLVPVDRIKCIIDIQHDQPWDPLKGLAIKTDHLPSHPDQITYSGQVLHPRDCMLRAQGGTRLRIALQSNLEGRIMPKIGRVIAVLIPGRNHQHPKPDELLQTVPHLLWVA